MRTHYERICDRIRFASNTHSKSDANQMLVQSSEFLGVNKGGLLSKTFRVARRPVVNGRFLLSLSNRGPALQVSP